MPAFNSRFQLNKFMGLPIAAVFLVAAAIVLLGLSFSVYLTFKKTAIAGALILLALMAFLIAMFLAKLGDRILFINLLVQNFLEHRSKPMDGLEKE